MTAFLRAMDAAQSRFDNALPAEKIDFLDTEDGDNWLFDSARALVCGDDLFYRSSSIQATRVEYHQLLMAVRQMLQNLDDDEFIVEQIVCRIVCRGESDSLFGLLRPLVSGNRAQYGWTAVHDLAESLIAPHAERWAQARAENDAEDCL